MAHILKYLIIYSIYKGEKRELTFKILIHIKCEIIRNTVQRNSPSQVPILQQQTSMTGSTNEMMARSPVSCLHPSARKATLTNPAAQLATTSNSSGQHSFSSHYHHNYHQQLNKPTQVSQETITNQLKIKIYFGGFNHVGFESRIGLVDKIVAEFNNELDNLIRLSYLRLILKDIHENKKWNNLLNLKGNLLALLFVAV